MKLTAKQTRFVTEYIKTLNGTQSAITAGYSPRTARSIASELLGKPQVRAEIERQEERRETQFRVEQDYLLRELTRAAEFDIAELFGENNRLLPPDKWPRDAFCVVTSLESKPLRGPLGQHRYKLKLTSRLKILRRIGEIVGAFSRKRTNKRKK